jgi:hypothetical protein
LPSVLSSKKFKNESGFLIMSKLETVRQAIEGIVAAVPTDRYFDSHYVIEELCKQNHELYLQGFAVAGGENGLIAHYHSSLSRMVRDAEKGEAVEKIGNAISHNRHGHSSPCALWRKK